jgi:hypothetical protein
MPADLNPAPTDSRASTVECGLSRNRDRSLFSVSFNNLEMTIFYNGQKETPFDIAISVNRDR